MIESPKQLDRRNEEFENATPREILSWASATYAEQLAIVTSFQHTGIVTLHMMHDIAPDTRVLTLDTGFLFPETVELMNRLEERFQLRLERIKPRQTPRPTGARLWRPALGAKSRQVLSHQKDNSSAPGFRWFRGLDYRIASRSVAEPGQHSNRQSRRANRPDQDRPVCQLERRDGVDLHPYPRPAIQPSARHRLSQYWLLDLHQGCRVRGQFAGRALVEPEQERVWHTYPGRY